MAAKYTHDHGAFGALVLKGGGVDMDAAVMRHAERIRAAAEASAPFDASDPAPHYKDQFSTEPEMRPDRVTAVVRNSSDHAGYVEFGNGHEGTAHHTLGNAMRSA